MNLMYSKLIMPKYINPSMVAIRYCTVLLVLNINIKNRVSLVQSSCTSHSYMGIFIYLGTKFSIKNS